MQGPITHVSIFIPQSQGQTELVVHCVPDGCRDQLYHSPTRRGMCTVFNPEPYEDVKEIKGLETAIARHFRLKKKVGVLCLNCYLFR